MNNNYIGILFIFLLGCNNPKKIDTNQLNGYWVIENVSKKNEVFNLDNILLADFYRVDKDSGWRTKVKPLLNNNYQTSKSKVFFKILRNKKKISLNLETPWDNWQEEILELDSISLILKINDKIYNYSRIK